ncbi:alpha/beta hydrolase family protein [Streptomyces cavernicola]|uniref:Alpha/beta hydrolase n=1 Tax=Streptomyces cavernicola TaxID=3043613 RepID=A0ABT6SJR3_9ACTN|nr:alpha/beta hydrolase [Streptomyces sp. B-S-A6]MDI3408124.1 alpha/beta hydrolase [Streptomyces sp. B-S-A6]
MQYALLRRGLTAAIALLTLAVGIGGPPASAAEEPGVAAPHLPRPTGPRAVGSTSLHLTDASRADPWVPEAGARELMVSLWYPTASPHGRRAQYMTPTESELLLREGGITGVPPDVLSTTRTHSTADARPAGPPRRLPLVVLSPGFGKPRATLTSLAEDLASHGYVVAAIDHTYESVATTFPGGRVATCAACEVGHDEAFWKRLVTGRAADVSFVLDELTGEHARWDGARLVDPARIAMAGHSVGGASAVPSMATDPRVRAGMDIDGTTDVPVPDSGLPRPFLFLGRQDQYTPGSGGGAVATWERDWPHLTGWKRWLVVAGAEHASFTDVGLLAEQLGLDIGAELPAARATEIVRSYTRAFLHQHLRHRAQPLLDRPSEDYPQVRFCTLETGSCT